jgi:hypothetical protein
MALRRSPFAVQGDKSLTRIKSGNIAGYRHYLQAVKRGVRGVVADDNGRAGLFNLPAQ